MTDKDHAPTPDGEAEPVAEANPVTEEAVDAAVRSVGKPVRRKGSRRVVMLSEVDAERIKTGEFGSAEEVLHAADRQPGDHKGSGAEPSKRTDRMSPRDREILNDVPPHFGNL